jgi:hypothetical protein
MSLFLISNGRPAPQTGRKSCSPSSKELLLFRRPGRGTAGAFGGSDAGICGGRQSWQYCSGVCVGLGRFPAMVRGARFAFASGRACDRGVVFDGSRRHPQNLQPGAPVDDDFARASSRRISVPSRHAACGGQRSLERDQAHQGHCGRGEETIFDGGAAAADETTSSGPARPARSCAAAGRICGRLPVLGTGRPYGRRSPRHARRHCHPAQPLEDRSGRAGKRVALPYGSDPLTCPVRVHRTWLEEAGIVSGPLFRGVDQFGFVSETKLHV